MRPENPPDPRTRYATTEGPGKTMPAPKTTTPPPAAPKKDGDK